MPIYVDLLRPDVPSGLPTVGAVITADIPAIDGCPILSRLKAYVVNQGVIATLEHVFRDKNGNAIDLSTWVDCTESLSSSESSSGCVPAGTIKMRMKEWVGQGLSARCNPVWEVYGEAVNAAAGVVRVTLEADMVEKAGIYEVNWAVLNENGVPVVVDRGITSIERTLFPVDVRVMYEGKGPPTLQEVRMMLMDSSAAENSLLDDMEFSDEQLMLCLTEPVRVWNETPPPIRKYTTRDFPYRQMWMSGTLGRLHIMAANNYRRNLFRHSAGGVTTNSKDKEKEYMVEGTRLWDEFRTQMVNKKIEVNAKAFCGSVSSEYAFRGGW